MVELFIVLEVSTINCELVIRVQLGFVFPLRIPRIGALAFDNKHAVMHSRAIILAPHFHFWRRRVVSWICSKNHIPVNGQLGMVEHDQVYLPITVKIMDLGRPQISRIVHARRRLEEKFAFSIVPICQTVAAIEGNVFVVGISHVVMIIVTKNPSIDVDIKH